MLPDRPTSQHSQTNHKYWGLQIETNKQTEHDSNQKMGRPTNVPTTFSVSKKKKQTKENFENQKFTPPPQIEATKTK